MLGGRRNLCHNHQPIAVPSPFPHVSCVNITGVELVLIAVRGHGHNIYGEISVGGGEER